MKACPGATCGVLTPAAAASPKSQRRTRAAAVAPSTWAVAYSATQRTVKSRLRANPMLTTGLK